MASYGFDKQNSDSDIIKESLKLNGFYLLKGVLNDQEIKTIREKLDYYLTVQESEFSQDELKSIKEGNQLRAPLQYDEVFLDMIMKPQIVDYVKSQLGDYYILHQQNSIINKPSTEHHQSAWHRDLPYQNLVISRPLAVNAYYCIDDFTPETGSTIFVPHTHNVEFYPSEEYLKENSAQLTAAPGDVILFDTMIIHKAGYNSSNQIRRGINNIFARPILRQQLDYNVLLKEKYANHSPEIKRMLGFDCSAPYSVKEFRDRQLDRQKNKK